ncbi:MAG: serine protease [Candidatus Obscuribacterales bacterium]|nr:serine protease [Candidatus Obscuribacterales bacterium]
MSYFEDILNQAKKQPPKTEQAANYKITEQAANYKILDETLFAKESTKVTQPKETFVDQQLASTHNRLNHKDAIFRIFAPQSNGENVGTGFFYEAQGKFLTDLHVLGDANTCKIVLNNGQQLTGVVDRRNRECDLVQGHVVEPKTLLPFLMIGNHRKLETNKSSTYAAGYAYGREFQILPGKFSKFSNAGIASDGDLGPGEDPSRRVILSKQFTPQAMSGGVILNEDYMPIGIIDKGDITNRGSASTTISTPISDGLKLIQQPRSYSLDAKR